MKIVESGRSLLVLSPHPDDVILGCGGLISQVKKAGGTVHVCLFTYGDYGNTEMTRRNEFIKVMQYLSVDSYKILF